ncbi:MAG: SRPBCC family protein [Acidobacteria bacterium]|nr:SRPBCC family protein [Acidobacteriota bacterium]
MRAHWVHVEHDFPAPPSVVFAHLAEHENLADVFQAKVTRLRDGDSERNGVGSMRIVKIGPAPPVEETVTEFETDELIEYRVTNKGLLKDHVGIMKFSELPDGDTHLDYRIRLSSHVPGLAVVLKGLLTRGIEKSFSRLDRELAAG